MPDIFAMSGNTPNYSGMLFNKGNTKTPFSTMIGARRRAVNHTEFVTGQEFETAYGSQPDISESKSLTAPDSSVVTREQKTNVTQIFQESVGISYGKMSNMGTMSGINIAGQQPNPPSAEDFQIIAKMAKIAQDIEYTFINGVYQKSTGDSVANRSRGLLNAITSNVIDADGKNLSFLLLCEALKLIEDSNGSLDDLVVGLDSTSRMQLNADAAANGLTIVDSGRTVNGITIDTVLTPLGTVGLRTLKYLPAGTIAIFDPLVMGPVEQPVPGRGNFFLEELARTGAGTKKQIFGQIGLDHGPEWYAAKITNLSTKMPKNSDLARKVFQITSADIATEAELGSLTVNSVASTTTSGKTKITVSPEKGGSNSYKYKIGGSESAVVLNQNVQTWSAWNGTDEIVATADQYITVVECDASYKAVKAGSTKVTVKP